MSERGRPRAVRKVRYPSRRVSSATIGLTLVVALLFIAGCAGGLPTDVCVAPPGDELVRESALDLVVVPDPVLAGTRATLSADPSGEFAGGFVGIGAELQCWDGSQWKPLFLLTRDKPDLPPSAIPVEPGQTTVVPAIGVPVPDSSEILIPDVPAGTYRIEDYLEDQGSVIGFVIVQITN